MKPIGVLGCLLGIGILLGHVTASSALPFTGTLRLELLGIDPIVIEGQGDGVSTPSNIALVSASLVTTTTRPALVGNTFPAFPIIELQLTGPAGFTAGAFAAGGGPTGGFGGNAPLAGNLRLGLFGPPPFAHLSVPLQVVGQEGNVVMASAPLVGVRVTAFGGGWTTGPVKVIGTTGPFRGVTLASASGFDNRTMSGAGTIQLVSPTLVKTNISPFENTGLIAVLELHLQGPPVDSDGDGVFNLVDNCPSDPNPGQEDRDSNGLGDLCNDAEDLDGDEWADGLDTCPDVPNPDQADLDGNGVGDVCNEAEDRDGDDIADDLDACPDAFNPGQEDTDGDGLADACDDFPGNADNLAQCTIDLGVCQVDRLVCDEALARSSGLVSMAQTELVRLQVEVMRLEQALASARAELAVCLDGEADSDSASSASDSDSDSTEKRWKKRAKKRRRRS